MDKEANTADDEAEVQDIAALDDDAPAPKDEPANRDPDELVADLRKQLKEREAELQRATEEAQRARREKETESARALTAAEITLNHHERALVDRRAALEAKLSSTERDLIDALERGEHATAVKLQRELATTQYQIEKVGDADEQLKSYREKLKTAPQRTETEPKFTAKTQAWIDAHPRFNSDEDYRNEAIAADSIARSRGLVPDTRAYFEFINTRMERMFPDADDGGDEDAPPPRASRAEGGRVAAPPSRGSQYGGPRTAGGDRSAKGKVRLTPEQREFAKVCGMSDEEYARELQGNGDAR